MISEYLPLFLAGLFGGVHCIGMCGGFVAALNSGTACTTPQHNLLFSLAYNLGRITTYCLMAFLIANLLLNYSSNEQQIASATILTRINDWKWWLAIIAQLSLLAMALYIAGIPQVLLPLERLFGKIWKKIQPVSRRFFPLRKLSDAYFLGLIWGLLPCGLVYAALIYAIAATTPWQAGLKMFAFALGTLPNLLFASFALQKAQAYFRPMIIKRIFALVIATFAIVALYRLFQ